MDLARFVRITRDNSPAGTGYLIARNLVLTARHVVAGTAKIEVRYDRADGEEATAEPTEPPYLGGGDLDIAVLRLTTDLDIPVVPLAPDRFRGDRSWRSRGWARAAPEIADDEANQVDHLCALAGTAYEFSAQAHSFEVGVNEPPTGLSWWKGASGAPVFLSDRSPERLVGVIVHGNQPFDGKRLRAVPLAAVWGDQFLAAIDYDKTREERRQRRRGELISSLASILDRQKGAAQAIAAENPEWQEAFKLKESGGYQGLATALCETGSWRKVIEALDRAHLKLVKQEEDEARKTPTASDSETIVRIVERVLPEVYYSTASQALPDGEGSFLALPIETETLAEITMAAIDGRDLVLDEVKEQKTFPKSPVQIDPRHSKVPQGFDFNRDAALSEWLGVIARWIGLDTDDLEALNSPNRLDEFAQRIDREIETEVEREGPRRYFVYPRNFAQGHAKFLERLKDALPSLRIVELTEKTRLEERDACEPLRAILFRSYERRNKKGRRRL